MPTIDTDSVSATLTRADHADHVAVLEVSDRHGLLKCTRIECRPTAHKRDESLLKSATWEVRLWASDHSVPASEVRWA